MDKFVGKRLDGRYEIQEIIGIGGMAVVYKAHDVIEDRTVAIKILKEEFTSNEEFIRRFKNESKAIAMLSHPNIVKVYDVSFGDLIQYIVMEYIDGITLKEFIERQGSLRWRDAVHFAVQILKGLQHAHDKGIVHRDVKPQNIIVLPDHTIKVTDFGIARFARSEQRTITDKAIGSVHYISPEQARGEHTDEKADIYSVGVILYEMLTGQVPFQAESAVSVAIMQLQREPKLPTEVNSSIPLGLEQITMHAMQKSVERRYQSAAEMLCDLDAFRKDPEKLFAYTAFVDNSPTKFVDTPIGSEDTDDQVVSETAEEISETEEEEETVEKNNIIPILTGVAVTLVLVLVAIGAIFLPNFLKKTTKAQACPDFSGMTWEEIKKSDYYKQYDIVMLEAVSQKKPGTVFDQSPKAGKEVKKGAKIKVWISLGEETVPVPDVSGKNEQQAKIEMESIGLGFESDHEYSDDVPEGLAVRSDPKAGSAAYYGKIITVYFSDGPEPVKVENVIGYDAESVKKILKDQGLKVSFKYNIDLSPTDTYTDKDISYRQLPAPGQDIEKEGTVTVYMSSGYVSYKSFDLPLQLDTNNSAPTIDKASITIQDSQPILNSKPRIVFDPLSNKIVIKDLAFKLDSPETANNVWTSMKIRASIDGKMEDLFELTVNVTNGALKDTPEQLYVFPELPDPPENDPDDSGDSSGDTSGISSDNMDEPISEPISQPVNPDNGTTSNSGSDSTGSEKTKR